VDPAGRLHERVLSLDTFREAFFAFFDRFVAERSDVAAWKKTLAEIHAWVSGRTAKR
jgi:hypothetical protein